MGIAQWESHGNGNWLQNWEWEWEGMGIDCMGMGGNGNVKSHSRPSLVDTVVPESQCGFRRQRSTIDMIFVASLLQEKCREQYQNLFLAFIDLTKAFDTVNRTLLWAYSASLAALHSSWPSYGNSMMA